MGAQWKAKHKDIAANAKGRLFGKLAKDIMVAARHGADPKDNARLRLVVEQARKVSMPKVTLDRAIKIMAARQRGLILFRLRHVGDLPRRPAAPPVASPAGAGAVQANAGRGGLAVAGLRHDLHLHIACA
jgi:Transcriptional regulator